MCLIVINMQKEGVSCDLDSIQTGQYLFPDD